MSVQVSTPAKRPTGEILFALVFVSVGVAGLLAAGSGRAPDGTRHAGSLPCKAGDTACDVAGDAGNGTTRGGEPHAGRRVLCALCRSAYQWISTRVPMLEMPYR